MTSPPATVLLVSVGSGIGSAVLDAIDGDPALRRRLRVVGVTSIAEAANNFRCDRCYLTPSPADAAGFDARLREIVAAEQPRVVIACRDDVLEPLARLAAQVDPARTTVLVSSAAVSAITNDKYATHLFAQRHGLPFADTAIDRDGLDRIERLHGYPMIAKPRSGHGSFAVSVARRRSEAEAALAAGETCVQPFIGAPGDLDALLPDTRRGVPLAYSLPATDMLASVVAVDRARQVIAYASWSVPLMILGEARRFEAHADPAIESATRDFTRALIPEGLFGPCVFQFRRDREGRPVCFEINGRLGGVEGARTALGFPLVRHLIMHFAFGPQPVLPPPPVAGHIVLRPLVDRAVDRALVARLTRDGVWAPG